MTRREFSIFHVLIHIHVQVTQRELDARSVNYKSVIKAGKELMKSKQGDDRYLLKRKLADLEQEWTAVNQSCNGRINRIEEAFKKVCPLYTHY